MTKSNNSSTSDTDEPDLSQATHWRQTAQRHYEPNRDGGLTRAIVFAIADAKGISPSEVKSPPLCDSVDVIGIEKTFFGLHTDEESHQGIGALGFRYTEYLVKVRSDGWILVYESSETEQV